MPLFVIVEVFNLVDVFLFFFDDVSVSTYYRRVIATTLFLALSVPRTSLVVLDFLAILALIGGRLLMLATRYVTERSVSALSSFEVFFFLFHGLLSLKTL